MKERVLVKFTNVCYMRGGGKVPYRIRKFQNHHRLLDKEYFENTTESKMINDLPYLSNYTVWPMNTTRVIKV